MVAARPPRAGVLSKASSSERDKPSTRICHLGPQLRLLARTPARGLFVWPGLPHSVAAGFQKQVGRKQLRCPSADEWIRKLWYIYTMEYYSAIKKNTFESVLMRWIKLEPIIQSEVSQKEKHQYSILTHIYGI